MLKLLALPKMFATRKNIEPRKAAKPSLGSMETKTLMRASARFAFQKTNVIIMQTGNTLIGHPVSANKFQGVTSLKEIRQFGLRRPSAVEVFKPTGDDEDMLRSKEMHEQMNRRFDSGRIHRAIDYCDYIKEVEVEKQMGGTPAITIWYPGKLDLVEHGIRLPYGIALTAIDGETQLEARYMLMLGIQAPTTIGRTKIKESRDAHPETGDNPIAVTLYHGIDILHAQQILRDYNAEAHPIDPKKASTWDHVGPMSVAVNEAIVKGGVPAEKVNRTGSIAGKKCSVAYQQVLAALCGYVLDGKDPEPVTATSIRLRNRPSSEKVPDNAVLAIAGVIRSGRLAQAPTIVWQAAGHKLSHGNGALNYEAGIAAYEATRVAGRGGPRMSPKTRLAAIVAAL